MKKVTSYCMVLVLMATFSTLFAQTSGSRIGTSDDDRAINWPGGSKIARASNGEVMAIYGTVAGPDSLVYSVTYDDFLETWNEPVAVGRGTGEGRNLSHACVLVDDANTFHALWSSNWNIVHATYNGSAWSTPVSVTGTATPWDTLRAAHTAAAFDSNGDLWVAWSTGWENDDVSEYYYISKSTDGTSWSTPTVLFADTIKGSLASNSLAFINIASGPAGKVGVTIRGLKGPLGQYAGAFQEYDGSTWGATEYLSDASGGPVFADSVDIYSISLAYDDAGVRHFVFYTAEADFDNADDGQIYYLKKNVDNTWTDPVKITNNPGGQADYPSIAFGGNDDLYVVYFGDDNDGIRRIYGLNSADLGATWTRPIQISTNSIDLAARAPSISNNIGTNGADIIWIEADGDDQAIMYGLIPKAVVSVDGVQKPVTHNLLSNYPNPFNPSTTIEFSIKQSGVVELNVYNTLGQEVAQLVNQKMESGTYDVTFNARSLSSGIYFYRLVTSDQIITNKLIYLK
ncbi:MAG: T9SS type A sorting domain-containing protein [Candidatus Marinimicrobia bacterium]|nr:T9SS type A sorting domain-containing protein [Candidatus Neomarinimicrobiota bacterium]